MYRKESKMNNDQLTELILALEMIKGVGPKTILNFFEAISPQAILKEFSNMKQNSVINKRINEGTLDYQLWQNMLIKAHELLQKSREKGMIVLNYQDNDYPDNLRSLKHFPLIIYVKGNVKALQGPSVAFIGTRRPTELGYKMSQRMAYQFANDGLTIISGLSIGTNTAAHQGALEAQGTTVAILGHSLEQPIYPKENEQLATEILRHGGALMSTFSLGAIVRRQFLAARDEWESGLADGLVVVETDQNGKTESALQHALKQNRPVAMLDHRQYPKIKNVMDIPQAIGNQEFIRKQQAFPLWDKESLRKFEHVMTESRIKFLRKSKRDKQLRQIQLF